MKTKIVPVILAGGSGTRLWPLSRKSSPKQFLKLIGNHSLFQETLLRVNQVSSVEEVVVVINESHYFICQDQIKEIEIANVKMILEPCSRNTAPAIALAANDIHKCIENDPLMLVLPADHLIGNPSAFSTFMESAAQIAKEKNLITFGIIPSSPKTGYGYIKSGPKIDDLSFKVEQFIEKPDKESAEFFLKAKNYYWNSGMFLFHAKTYLEELKKIALPIYKASLDSYNLSITKADYLRIDEKSFEKCPNDSIDYAVMEKTHKAAVIPFKLPWSDLGCWASVADAGDSDENMNVIRGNVILKDCERCLLTSDSKQLVATIGIKDLIVVSTADAVLVAAKEYAQEVKEIVSGLNKTDRKLTLHHKQMQCSWGYYEKIVENPDFQIRHLAIHPKKEVILKSSGSLTVIHGKIEVKTPEKSIFLTKKNSQPIPARSHIINYGDELAHILELDLASENIPLSEPLETVEALLNRNV